MSKIPGETRATASAGEIQLIDGMAPERIQLLRMGENAKRDGGKPFLVADRAHAEAIVAASRAYHKSTDPMVDYDHQSVFGAKDGVGGTAPAAGWMSDLTIEDDGIYAPVAWTKAAAAAIADRAYRYISPYFGHQADGRVTRIFNAALTNRPELELRAVASQSDLDMTDPGDFMKTLAAALGLPEGAPEADILTAINVIIGDRTAVCSVLGLPATADKAAIAVKIGELKTTASAAGGVDPAKFVPVSEFNSLRDRVNSLGEDRVTASVDDAVKAGKITPAGRDWALGYAKADPDGFAKFLAAQPVIVAEGREEREAAAAKDGKLTGEQKAICSQMGLSEEDFLKSLKEEKSL